MTTFNPKRRNFIVLATNTVVGLGAASAVFPLLKSMSPSAEVRALSTIEVNVSSMVEGQSMKVIWQGNPVFIRKRTNEEIEKAKEVDINTLRHRETDEQRTKKGKENWLVMVGICTHLGCIPVLVEENGHYNGWFCPCHGSHYDTSGRIMKGPAPKNLRIPDYQFVSDDIILIGRKEST
ncbi:MAG: ubiquinol-cytochrome c reductase iron-sulfur subunit [Rickettsiaceae bacterium H1]|nr:ubiquinol-cytochrome c reductase iron-sulfur subunit [Rickettsiaceae bacterium H1]